MSSDRAYRHVALNDDEFNDTAAARIVKKNRRKRNLKVCLCISAVAVILIAIVSVALYFGFRNKGSKSRSTDICSTLPSISASSCVSPAVCNSKILDYIDYSYKPCEDFYSYSCGNWLANNPLNGRDSSSIFSDLFINNYCHLRGYLSRSVQKNDLVATKKTKYVYSSCANVDFIQSHFVEHVRNFIKDAGGWSDIGITPDNGWDINDDLANDHYLGSSALFGFYVSPDDLNSSKPVIRVS